MLPKLVFRSRLTIQPHLAFRRHFSPYSSAGPSSRLGRYTRRTAYVVVGLTSAWVIDRSFNASALTRNLHTLWTCAAIALDYKLYFTPELSSQIPELHQRVANRLYDLLTSNGGLYIKIGQALASNAALMPAPMQEKFSKLFDDAPQVPYSVVRKVFEAEFGRPPAGPDGVFEIFEEQAVASASIAQVHRAKTKQGEWVAVKVQKPDVGKQVEWDLGAFGVVMWIYEHYLFDMPATFAVEFISDHLRRELDFELEAQNAQRTAEFVAREPRLADRVYIPRVYPELTTKRVMVAEWIDGVRLSDRAGIMALMGERDARASPSRDVAPVHVPPSQPLRGGVKAIMQTMVELFSAQIFEWGWVHCDPHPGNIIIRANPAHLREPQLVLLDHGLYVAVSKEFQIQYARLWKGLLTADFSVIQEIATQWGIGTPDLFASATLMRPVKFGKGGDDFMKLSEYERSVMMKEKLKGFLIDTDKMPKALLFIGRNMRMVQGNNQVLGSPVNRIRITGYWASRSLMQMPHLTLRQRLQETMGYVIYLTAILSLDIVFWTSKLRQWMLERLGRSAEGFEDELERTMRGFAKSNFGVEIVDNAFDG